MCVSLSSESKPFPIALNTNSNITTMPWRKHNSYDGDNGQRGIFAIVTHEYFSTTIHGERECNKSIGIMSIDFLSLSNSVNTVFCVA